MDNNNWTQRQQHLNTWKTILEHKDNITWAHEQNIEHKDKRTLHRTTTLEHREQKLLNTKTIIFGHKYNNTWTQEQQYLNTRITKYLITRTTVEHKNYNTWTRGQHFTHDMDNNRRYGQQKQQQQQQICNYLYQNITTFLYLRISICEMCEIYFTIREICEIYFLSAKSADISGIWCYGEWNFDCHSMWRHLFQWNLVRNLDPLLSWFRPPRVWIPGQSELGPGLKTAGHRN